MSKPIDIKTNKSSNSSNLSNSDNIDYSPKSFSPSPNGTKMRCFECKKKLNLIEQTSGLCKCGNVFCSKHKTAKTVGSPDPSSHLCSWDHLKKSQKLLQQKNPIIAGSKLERI
jgi:hypothetical protein